MKSSRTPSFRGWSKLLFCVSAIAILYAFLPASIPVARAAIAHCQFDDTSGFLHGFHGKLEDASGCEVRLIGVNWFGFETRTFSPHGLWARNWQEMLDQIAQAGFNTLRLPFSNQLFDPSSKPQGIDYKLNPDLKGLSGLALLDRIIPLYSSGQLKKSEENFWAARAALIFGEKGKKNKHRSIDRGIFSIYFFNLLQLRKGEGLFQDAGVPHAYLEGQNVEIMANSDNVLRGGLTNKHVDVKELMKHIKFEETVPQIILPERINNCEELYRTGAPDFKLSRFTLKRTDTCAFESASGEIVFVFDGAVSISSERDQLSLSKGEAAFIISHRRVSLKCLADAELYRATVPVHSSE